MSKKNQTTPISLAISAVFAAGVVASPALHADVNPFAITALSTGYMVASSGNAGEGQCGANKRLSEAKCGAEQAAQKVVQEGECGSSKTVKEGECGASKAKAQPKPIKEAKCGEAKCGANK